MYITRNHNRFLIWLTVGLAIIGHALQGVNAQGDDCILFVSDRDGNLDIYVMQADGTNVQRLTTDPGLDIEPAWSPDRQQIAFTSNRGGGNYGVYVMNADGSNLYRVTPEDGNYYAQPTWSPDGQRLALVSDRSGSLDVYTISVTGGNLQAVTDHPGEDEHPTWSSDMYQIAFASSRDGFFEIFIVENGGQPPQLFASSAEAEHTAPVWSPDGQYLAYIATGNGYAEIYIKSAADGSERILVTEKDAYIQSLTWSPNGQYLAYEKQQKSKSTILIVNIDGQSSRQAVDIGDSNAKSPSWSAPEPRATVPDPSFSSNTLQVGSQARVYVEDEGLKLRSGPGTSYSIVENLPRGSVVTLIGEPQPGGGYVWWQVRSAIGNEGWSVEAADGLSTLVPIPALRVGSYAEVYVEDEGLKLRSGPGTDYPIVENLPRGSIVTLIGEPQVRGGYVWWQVRSAIGNEGWSVEAADGLTTLIPR